MKGRAAYPPHHSEDRLTGHPPRPWRAAFQTWRHTPGTHTHKSASQASVLTRLRPSFYHGAPGWSSLRAWLPALLLMLVIFVLSSQPSLPGPEDAVLDTFLKKFMHAAAYALLARAYFHGLSRTTRLESRQAWVLAWVLAALYALSDEAHQALVPHRHGRLADWIIDLCGAGMGLLARGWPRKSVPEESRARPAYLQKAAPDAPEQPAA